MPENFRSIHSCIPLRRFIRINTIKKSEIDEFVRSVSGKRLSIRDIDLLANGYFKGPDEFRAQIKTGNLFWGLERLKRTDAIGNALSEREKNHIENPRNHLEIHAAIYGATQCRIHEQRVCSPGQHFIRRYCRTAWDF